MGCGCAGTRRKSSSLGPNEVIGYEYISPAGVSSLQTHGALFMTLAEARVEQRANGGGTIRGRKRGEITKPA